VAPVKMLPLWVVQGALFGLFCFSYVNAKGEGV
jgi:hypothetical protein